MRRPAGRWLIPMLALGGCALGYPRATGAQTRSATEGMETGEGLFRAACANCHGADGAGVDRALLALQLDLPDFSDCSFASREPSADWVAVAHDGGPARGFSEIMPAFGGALTREQLERVIEHVRTLCRDASWPRGELNLPRALATEKAYPEDEAVVSTSTALDGPASVASELVYERRFGARNQIELKIPYGFRKVEVVPEEGDLPDPADPAEPDERWVTGPGDIVVGVKRTFLHSLESGSIFALAAELTLSTGDAADGFGGGTKILEAFASYGQILPGNAFLQLQAGAEHPTDPNLADEAFWRGALGVTFTQGDWGRAWSPMVEVLGGKELDDDEKVVWDVLPQMQVTLNTRQHVMINVGVRLPLTDSEDRPSQLVAYLLWDWFDGGFLEGW